jgi:hypothetical protein
VNEDVIGTIPVEGGVQRPGKLLLLTVAMENLPRRVLIGEDLPIRDHHLQMWPGGY